MIHREQDKYKKLTNSSSKCNSPHSSQAITCIRNALCVEVTRGKLSGTPQRAGTERGLCDICVARARADARPHK